MTNQTASQTHIRTNQQSQYVQAIAIEPPLFDSEGIREDIHSYDIVVVFREYVRNNRDDPFEEKAEFEYHFRSHADIDLFIRENSCTDSYLKRINS